jgi:superfamily II DNA or RNA helicase
MPQIDNADPLKLRLTECPQCRTRQLVSVSDLQRHVKCNCRQSFLAEEHIVVARYPNTHGSYSTWNCPKCSRVLLIPRFAVEIPGICPCGNPYSRQRYLQEWTLDTIQDAFLGNDPLLAENMLIPLRAAQRYEYEITHLGMNAYCVKNPTKGTSYVVELSSNFVDSCECETFQASYGTCIHVEHARLKLRLPSTAQAIAEAETFAYAWLDKSSLPPRIRIGWTGNIERQARIAMKGCRGITCLTDLHRLREILARNGIDFRTLPSAVISLQCEAPIQVDTALAQTIADRGKAFLSQRIPQLHTFQADGALFLSTAQRALLLDEMGLGKTIQALAAACLLREFAGIESCLVVAPKSVLEHWRNEIERFVGESATLVEGKPQQRACRYNSKSLFKVVTLETLRRDFPDVGHHDLIVVDEVQKLRNLTTKSSRVLRQCNSRFFIGLSGTAVEKSLEDLYGILTVVRPEALESPLEMYASHLVCDDFGKVKRTLHPEYFCIRHADRILRRTKQETELAIPALHIKKVELELTPLQADMAQPLRAELGEVDDRLKQQYNVNDFIRRRWLVNRIVELSNGTQMHDPATSASSKMEWLNRFLGETCVRSREKVVIFTRWVRSQRMILRVCQDLGVKSVSLSGDDSIEVRQLAINRFTNDKDILVFVSTDAGGVGVNLQVARTIVNLEPAWNPSTDAQRIQRVHRIGQCREVFAFSPITELDEFFTLMTHPKKSFAANAIDVARSITNGEAPQTWEELVPVILHLQQKASEA